LRVLGWQVRLWAMTRTIVSLPLLIALAGCAALEPKGDPAPGSITGTPDPEAAAGTMPAAGTTGLGARAVRAETLDTSTPEEKAAALAAPAASGERNLGRVIVALGPPAEQGIWLRTSLVSQAVQGRIVTATGKSLAVELRPGTGGALLSLAAFQALGLSLTGLPEVTVFGP
jgi:hypothetical protein